jgi:hypothetical protein
MDQAIPVLSPIHAQVSILCRPVFPLQFDLSLHPNQLSTRRKHISLTTGTTTKVRHTITATFL